MLDKESKIDCVCLEFAGERKVQVVDLMVLEVFNCGIAFGIGGVLWCKWSNQQCADNASLKCWFVGGNFFYLWIRPTLNTGFIYFNLMLSLWINANLVYFNSVNEFLIA